MQFFSPSPILVQLASPVLMYPIGNPQFSQGGWAPVLGTEADLSRRLWEERQWRRIYQTLHTSLQLNDPSAAQLLDAGHWQDLCHQLDTLIAVVANRQARAHLHLQRGVLHLLAGQWQAAAADLAKAAEETPAPPEVVIIQAITLQRCKKFTEADQLLGQLVAELRPERLATSVVALCLSLQAAGLGIEHRYSDALCCLQLARSTYSDLAAARPDLWASDIALVLLEIGYCQYFQQEGEQAVKEFAAAIHWADKAARAYPMEALPLLAVTHRCHGMALLNLCEESQALTAFERALDALSRSVEFQPDRREDLIRLQLEYGQVVEESDADLAKQTYLEAAQSAVEGASHHPDRYHYWQAVAELQLASHHSEAHQSGPAIPHYIKAIALLEALPVTIPDLKSRLCTAHLGLGSLLVDSRLWNDGAAALEKAIDHGRAAAQELQLASESAEISLLVCEAKLKLASARLCSGRRDDAENLLIAARNEARQYMDYHPEEALITISELEGELLAIYSNERRFDLAEDTVRHAMDFLRPFAERDPASFGDAYAVQARYLIPLLMARKAPESEHRKIALEAASLAHQPVIKRMMEQIARGA